MVSTTRVCMLAQVSYNLSLNPQAIQWRSLCNQKVLEEHLDPMQNLWFYGYLCILLVREVFIN